MQIWKCKIHFIHFYSAKILRLLRGILKTHLIIKEFKLLSLKIKETTKFKACWLILIFQKLIKAIQ